MKAKKYIDKENNWFYYRFDENHNHHGLTLRNSNHKRVGYWYQDEKKGFHLITKLI